MSEKNEDEMTADEVADALEAVLSWLPEDSQKRIADEVDELMAAHARGELTDEELADELSPETLLTKEELAYVKKLSEVNEPIVKGGDA